MAAVVTTILPEINKRVPVDSTMVLTFDTQLAPATVIKSNVTFLDSSNIPIAFTVSNTPTIYDVSVIPDADLLYDSIYTLTLSAKIEDSGNNPITPKTITFLSKIQSDIPEVDLTVDGNANDIFYKNLIIPDLLDTRKILEDGDNFNFKYVPTFKNEVTGEFYNSSIAKLNFDNQDFFVKKIREQFLSTFELYFKNIENQKILSDEEYEKIKIALYPQSYSINTSSGLIRKIKYILELYGKMLGYNFVAVEADPIEAFIYYISTDIPIDHWNRLMKQMVHPVGWDGKFISSSENLLPYYQTENYDWTDEFLLNEFRTNFYLLGQREGILVPSTISLDPPTLDPIGSISGDYTTTQVRNYTSDKVADNWKTQAYLIGDIITENGYLLQAITAGTPSIEPDWSTLSWNTSTTTDVDILDDVIRWRVIGIHESTTQRDLLSVLNHTRVRNKWVFSYLEAGTLGSVFESSRLTFDADGQLQLIVVPNSLITTFFEEGGDTVFRYDDETNPILFVEGDDFIIPNVFEFGNVDLENIVTEHVLVSGDNFSIQDVSAPLNGIQTLTFSENIDGNSPSSGIIEATNTLIITGFSNNENNGTFSVLTHDYLLDQVTISNVSGVSETPSPAQAIAERQIPENHNVVTLIIPDVFSNDFQIWNGFTYYFNQNKIDPYDYTSKDEFDYKYAKYDAPVTYPKEGSGDTPYDTFVAELDTPSYFYDFTVKCLAKSYVMTTPNVIWTQGNKVYELMDESGSADIADGHGIYHGFIEKYDSISEEIVVKFLNTDAISYALDDGGSFTDYLTHALSYPTTESPFVGDNDVILLPSVPEANDAFYFIFDQEFSDITMDIGQAGSGDWVFIWEYSTTGDTWTPVSVTDETNSFKNSGYLNISLVPPADWVSTTIDSGGINKTGYVLRARIDTVSTYPSQPKANRIWINTGFHPNKYYSNTNVEKGLLSANTDTSVEFGTYGRLFDRKISLGYKLADFNNYTWELYADVGYSEGDIEHTEFNNKLVMMGQPNVIYDVDLSVELSRTEVATITTLDDVATNLNSTYFMIYSTNDDNSYYVWYNVDAGGVDPAPSGLTTGIEVAISENDTKELIAQLTANALNDTLLSPIAPGDDFTVTYEDEVITVTNNTAGPATDVADSAVSGAETLFGFETLAATQGRYNLVLLHPTGQSDPNTWTAL